jgi:hypothetical protein
MVVCAFLSNSTLTMLCAIIIRIPVSLNRMAHSATIEMIKAVIAKGVNVKEVT